MTAKGTTVDLPAALSAPERRMLKQYETEADKALGDINRSAVALGRALRDIQNEQLYRAQGTFKDYVSARFGVSKSTAYRCIQVYEWTQAHPELPVPKLWELEPGKVAAKAAPKPADVPRVGHGPQPVPAPEPEPDIVDAEWSDEIPSGSAGSVSPAQLPQRTPVVVDLMGNLEAPLAPVVPTNREGESHVSEPVVASDAEVGSGAVGVCTPSAPGPAESMPTHDELSAGIFAWLDERRIDHDPGFHRVWIGHGWVDGKWVDVISTPLPGFPIAAVTPADVLARLAETKPDTLSEDEFNAYMAATGHPQTDADKAQGAIDALILLLESVDLETMGAAMTADQVDTVMRAAETLRDAHAIATKPREKLSKGQRGKATARKAPVAAKSPGGLGRREVEPNFKPAKVVAK